MEQVLNLLDAHLNILIIGSIGNCHMICQMKSLKYIITFIISSTSLHIYSDPKKQSKAFN